jgi:hypothetical protein
VPTPARHPFAYVTVDAGQHPALIIEWERRTDANGFTDWWARCVWFDGELQEGWVVAERVRRAD